METVTEAAAWIFCYSLRGGENARCFLFGKAGQEDAGSCSFFGKYLTLPKISRKIEKQNILETDNGTETAEKKQAAETATRERSRWGNGNY